MGPLLRDHASGFPGRAGWMRKFALRSDGLNTLVSGDNIAFIGLVAGG